MSFMVDSSTHYLGNPKIKKSGVKIEFTEEQVKEYIKCSKDPIYFAKKYVKIISIDQGLIPFNMWDFQEKMVKMVSDNRFSIIKLPRQCGKTLTMSVYCLWLVLFHNFFKVAILANKDQKAKDILAAIKLAYENIPIWLQQGIITWNKGMIELENGSKIISSATSSSSARGDTYSLLFLDEFAFVPFGIQGEFFRSVYPTISSGKSSKIIIISTPCGYEMFYKLFTDAKNNKNSYKWMEIKWHDIPGRDASFKEETIKNVGEFTWRQEYEASFIGSQYTLIDPSVIENLVYKNPIYTNNTNVYMYEKPKNNHMYIGVVDTAEGMGMDYTVLSIIDVTKIPYEQVFIYRDNLISPLVIPEIIVNYVKKYNNATLLIETNGVGAQIASDIYFDLEYEDLIMTTNKGRKGQQISSGFSNNVNYGIKMTQLTKKIGCSTLKTLIEQHKLIIYDFNTIAELSVFINNGKNSWEAEEGHHDDIVDTLILFSWLTNQNYFKELTGSNIRLNIAKQDEDMLIDKLIPFGIIDSDNYSSEVPIVCDDYTEDGIPIYNTNSL